MGLSSISTDHPATYPPAPATNYVRRTIIAFVVWSTLALILALYDTLGRPICGGALFCFWEIPLSIFQPVFLALTAVDAFMYYYVSVVNLSIPFRHASLVKFIVLFLLTALVYAEGYMLSFVLLYFKAQRDRGENILHIVRRSGVAFAGTATILFLALSVYFFIKQPPAPFASAAEILAGCGADGRCIRHYLHYTIPNCNNDTALFLFPSRRKLPEADHCFMKTFIASAPLKEHSLSIICPKTAEAYAQYCTETDLDGIFGGLIGTGDAQTRRAICASLTASAERECLIKFKVLQATGVDRELCEILFSLLYDDSHPAHRACLKKFGNFRVILPRREALIQALGIETLPNIPAIAFVSDNLFYELTLFRSRGEFSHMYLRESSAVNAEIPSHGSVGEVLSRLVRSGEERVLVRTKVEQNIFSNASIVIEETTRTDTPASGRRQNITAKPEVHLPTVTVHVIASSSRLSNATHIQLTAEEVSNTAVVTERLIILARDMILQ